MPGYWLFETIFIHFLQLVLSLFFEFGNRDSVCARMRAEIYVWRETFRKNIEIFQF